MNRRLFLPTLTIGMALLGACGGGGDTSAPEFRARIDSHARPPTSVSYTATVLSLGGTSGSGSFNEPGQIAGTSTLADGTHTRAFFFDGSTLVDLGAAPGQDSTFVALNDSGQVVGYEASANSVAHQAFLWTAAGGKMYLGSIPGAFAQTPTALNNAGEVVGEALLSVALRHAFFWSPSTGRAVDLGTLGGTATQVAGINDAGQAVGGSFLAGNFIEHAFVWTSAGGMADLGTLGGQQSMATLINSAGQVVGISWTPILGAAQAFFWTPATGMIAIGALGGGISEPVQLTESGQVVGHSWADSLGTLHGFSWTAAGGMVDLGTVPGGRSSQAFAVNASGVIMGASTTGAGNLHAVVWPPAGGIVDLGTLGGPLATALSINDAGEVVGTSDTASGDRHAFVWSELAGMLDLNDVTPDKPPGAVLTRATQAHDSGAILTESTAGLVLLRPRPNGFVTGGGWIDSPAGAVTADAGVAGRATFSVAARVPDGATVPEGELQFELSAAGVSFSSDAYAWLRIAGGEARLAGTGSLNGTPGYHFMLRAVDGAITGEGNREDRLRLTISHATASGDVVDYDNGLGAIGGGNIVIHRS